MKTKKEWFESKLSLDVFLNPGDEVDEEMFYYFLEVLPPAYQGKHLIQIGEPADSDERGMVYDTIKIDYNCYDEPIKYTYMGRCHRGNAEDYGKGRGPIQLTDMTRRFI
jgi:hypothetical protein